MSGGTPSTSNPEYWDGDIPWISSKSLTDFNIRDSDRHLTEKGVRSGTKLVSEDTILMVVRGMSLKSEFRMGIARREVALSQDLKALKPHKELDPLFLAYALRARTAEVLDMVDEAGHGTGRLQTDRLFSLEITFPEDLDEQRDIAASLGALDDKIESNRHAIDLAESLADALFMNADRTTAKLSDVSTIVMGSSPPGDTYNEDGDGMPFYQGVRDFGRRYPRLRIWTTGPVRIAEVDDTLISVRAPVGSLNRAGTPCCIGRGVAAARSETPSTLYYALRAAQALWEPFQQEGTVFGAINRDDLNNAAISWPLKIDVVEPALACLDARIQSLSTEIQLLVAERDTLLPELLSGRIRVPVGAAA